MVVNWLHLQSASVLGAMVYLARYLSDWPTPFSILTGLFGFELGMINSVYSNNHEHLKNDFGLDPNSSWWLIRRSDELTRIQHAAITRSSVMMMFGSYMIYSIFRAAYTVRNVGFLLRWTYVCLYGWRGCFYDSFTSTVGWELFCNMESSREQFYHSS